MASFGHIAVGMAAGRFYVGPAAPWRPIPVAPIGSGMFSARGRYVVLWEMAVFSPLWANALTPRRRSQPAR